MRIYCYTGTGNCRWSASKPAERLGGARLISMKTSRDPLIPEGCDRLGFIFPVHMFGLTGAVVPTPVQLEKAPGRRRYHHPEIILQEILDGYGGPT